MPRPEALALRIMKWRNVLLLYTDVQWRIPNWNAYQSKIRQISYQVKTAIFKNRSILAEVKPV